MHARFVDTHCARLEGAERVQPFGEDTVVWRVNGHMFAAYTDGGEGLSLRTKHVLDAVTPNAEAITADTVFSKAAGWLQVTWDTPPDVLRSMIDESYRLVRRDWPRPTKQPPVAEDDE